MRHPSYVRCSCILGIVGKSALSISYVTFRKIATETGKRSYALLVWTLREG